MPAQRKTLCILRIEVLSYQVRMKLENFEALVASSVFNKLPKETLELLTRLMSAPVETASVEGSMAFEGTAPEIASVEVPAEVPKL